MLWFYETLGLKHVRVDGDFLVVDENGIFGYNLRRMYEQFKVSDEEHQKEVRALKKVFDDER